MIVYAHIECLIVKNKRIFMINKSVALTFLDIRGATRVRPMPDFGGGQLEADE